MTADKLPSRIHSAVHVLEELARVRGKIHRAYLRADTPALQAWCRKAYGLVDEAVKDGLRTLPRNRDPRPFRRVRKSGKRHVPLREQPQPQGLF